MSIGTTNSNFPFSQVSINQIKNQNIQLNLQNEGLFSKEQCKSQSRQIVQVQHRNIDNFFETMQVAKWMVDCYRAMNRSSQPTATNIASYMQVVDKNCDGKISFVEMQRFILTYLHNTNRN